MIRLEIASRAVPMPRSKASFTPQEFADAMDSLVASNGKSFCTYSDESGQVAKAVLDKSSLQENHDVLEVMRGLAGKLAMKKSTVLAGLDIILLKYSAQWKFDERTAKDWKITFRHRIRHLGRVAAQGEGHLPNAAWVKDLPWRIAASDSSQLESTPMKDGRNKAKKDANNNTLEESKNE